MKIIREPSVYLVGRQVTDQADLDRFLADHGLSWQSDSEVGGECLAEAGGRLCYMSFGRPRPGGNKAYLDHILRSGHGSVLEHAAWSLVVTGVSRALSHELVRHRAGVSPSQLSQRYVDESVAEYVEPDVIADDPDLHRVWADAVRTSHDAYVKLVEGLTAKFAHLADPTARRKEARQAARSVLPNATETKLFLTANARAIRHMLEMRCSRHADREIRKLFMRVHEVMLAEAPNLFSDYRRVDLGDGTFELATDWRKV